MCKMKNDNWSRIYKGILLNADSSLAIACNWDTTNSLNSVKSTLTSAGNCTSQDHK